MLCGSPMFGVRWFRSNSATSSADTFAVSAGVFTTPGATALERPVRVDRGGDHAADRCLVAHVGEHGGRLTARLADLLDGLFTAGEVDVGDDDLRTGVGKPRRAGAADAGTGAGDDGDLAFQSAHVAPLLGTSPRERERAAL